MNNFYSNSNSNSYSFFVFSCDATRPSTISSFKSWRDLLIASHCILPPTVIIVTKVDKQLPDEEMINNLILECCPLGWYLSFFFDQPYFPLQQLF